MLVINHQFDRRNRHIVVDFSFSDKNEVILTVYCQYKIIQKIESQERNADIGNHESQRERFSKWCQFLGNSLVTGEWKLGLVLNNSLDKGRYYSHAYISNKFNFDSSTFCDSFQEWRVCWSQCCLYTYRWERGKMWRSVFILVNLNQSVQGLRAIQGRRLL